uniref:Polyadenylate-binding protein, putative n=1 Tax=Arundo donax TaxID=35708 RepID=A0A0A9FS61_ARUDO
MLTGHLVVAQSSEEMFAGDQGAHQGGDTELVFSTIRSACMMKHWWFPRLCFPDFTSEV